MKTVKSKGITILTGAAALALTGITLTATANADHDYRRGGNSIFRTVRALDGLTDRMHSMAKRELRYGRDARSTVAMICELENRADRLRSGVENGIPAPAVNRLARSVEECAQSVAQRLRRAHVSCELSEIAAATLEQARSVGDTFVARGRSNDRIERGYGSGHIDRGSRRNVGAYWDVRRWR